MCSEVKTVGSQWFKDYENGRLTGNITRGNTVPLFSIIDCADKLWTERLNPLMILYWGTQLMSGCRCTADLGMFKCLFFKKHLKETDLSAVLWLQTFWFTKLLPSRHTQTNHLFIHRSIFMLLPRIKINKDQSSRLSSCHHLCHIHPSNAPSIHSLISLFCLSTPPSVILGTNINQNLLQWQLASPDTYCVIYFSMPLIHCLI